MSRVATTSHQPGRAPQHQPFARPLPTSYAHPQQQHYRQQPHTRVPKYSRGYETSSKTGQQTEVLTLDSDDEESPQPQPGPSNYAAQQYASQAAYQQQPVKKRKGELGVNGSGNGYGPSSGPTHRHHEQHQYAQPTVGTGSKKRKADPGGNDDLKSEADKEGHYIVVPGNSIRHEAYGRTYQIESQLGMGTFGKVVKARTFFYDSTAKAYAEGSKVAVKVIRAVPKYHEAAKVEINVLSTIKDLDKPSARAKSPAYEFVFNADSQCIHMQSNFVYKKHTCIVTELLGVSVFDFLKSTGYQPFSFKHIQSFARQLLDSIAFLHHNKITHTDLKPENILLVKDSFETKNVAGKLKKRLLDTTIKLIDFGSATFDHEYHATVVSTRHYRAPEIILGLGWGHECDVWSIGCILVEFFTGEALFQTHENVEHLAMMQKVFGPMPREYAAEAARKAIENKTKDWFNSRRSTSGSGEIVYSLNFPDRVESKQSSQLKQSVKFVNKMETLDAKLTKVPPTDAYVAEAFCELVTGLLQWRKHDRLTARDALEFDFCQMTIAD